MEREREVHVGIDIDMYTYTPLCLHTCMHVDVKVHVGGVKWLPMKCMCKITAATSHLEDLHTSQ